LKTPEKLMKIDFSSVVKRGICTRKVIILMISEDIHFDDDY